MPEILKSALFVDFDNIYLGLKQQDADAAETFANYPGRWLEWLQEFDKTVIGADRRLLMRRCYLNPSSFGRFRASFVRAGFEVIDCPPLTNQGKTSADIHMVMDMLDALSHATHFDEFIVFSGDADFTPVLIKLRAHNRRTMTMATSFSAASFKAASDEVLTDDVFIEEALGRSDGVSRPEAPALPVVPANGGGAIRRRNGGTEASPDDASQPPLHQRVIAVIDALVKESDDPVTSAVVAFRLRASLASEIGSNWGGAGSLKDLVRELPPEHAFVVDWAVPGYFYDPARHSPPRSAEIAEGPGEEAGEEDFGKTIHFHADVPYLSPEMYREVFRRIAQHADENEFHIAEASKALRDSFIGEARPMSRQAANFILKGISFGGYQWRVGPGANSPSEMAEKFRDNVRNIVTQIEWTPEEVEKLEAWISSDE